MENNVDLMGVVTAKQARSYGGLSPQIFASYASTAKYYFRDDKIEILFTKYTSKYRVF